MQLLLGRKTDISGQAAGPTRIATEHRSIKKCSDSNVERKGNHTILTRAITKEDEA